MALKQSPLVQVKRTKDRGRGVFAAEPIPEGTEFERVPVLVLPIDEVEASDLADYAFLWGKSTVAIALGYGSLYNHSYEPNARYEDAGVRTKVFIALRDIEPGEEITINYNGEPTDLTEVGFDVV